MRTVLLVFATLLGSYQLANACPMPLEPQPDICPQQMQFVGSGLVEFEQVSELGIYSVHYKPALVYRDPCCNLYLTVPKLRPPQPLTTIGQAQEAQCLDVVEYDDFFSSEYYPFVGKPRTLHRAVCVVGWYFLIFAFLHIWFRRIV